ncbi:M20 family metallopeptidase [Chloroflexota bacterium]
MVDRSLERDFLVAEVDKRRNELVGVCGELIRRPSPSPPGSTAEVASFVAQYLESEGLTVDWVVDEPDSPNLAARLKGPAGGRHLSFIGHMDTYPVAEPEAWNYDPFGAVEKEGRIYGRGASDMKGGLAASMVAVAAFAQLGDGLCGQVDLLAVSSEVSFGPEGAPFLLAQRPDLIGEAAITAEPLYHGAVGCGEKGMLWLEIAAEAPGGGGFQAGSDASAVERLIEVLRQMKEIGSWRYDLPPEFVPAAGDSQRDLESVTLNIGRIEGGDKVNLLPQSARAEVDIRLPVGITCSEVEQYVDDVVQRVPDVQWRVVLRSEPNFSDPGDPLFGCLNNALSQCAGGDLPLGLYLPGSDARLFRHRGVPAASFGAAAYGEGCPDEYVLIDDMVLTAKVLALTAFDFCRLRDCDTTTGD